MLLTTSNPMCGCRSATSSSIMTEPLGTRKNCSQLCRAFTLIPGKAENCSAVGNYCSRILVIIVRALRKVREALSIHTESVRLLIRLSLGRWKVRLS